MKDIYSFEVSEQFARIVHVRAESRDEAWEKIDLSYCDGEILLDSNDWVEGSCRYELLVDDHYMIGDDVIE
jgi:hypothetical protein